MTTNVGIDMTTNVGINMNTNVGINIPTNVGRTFEIWKTGEESKKRDIGKFGGSRNVRPNVRNLENANSQ